MTISGAFGGLRDAFRLFFTGWISRSSRPHWHSIRWQIRTSSFRARSRIPTVPLAALIQELGFPSDVRLPGPGDWAGVGDAEFYYAIAAITAARKPRAVVEFGTYVGVSTVVIALNTEGQITTIDLPEDPATTALQHLDATDRTLVEKSRGRIGEAFRGRDLSTWIKQLLCDSSTLELKKHVNQADLVLIDGGHSYDLVRADTENALSVAPKGSVLLWDDYWWLYPGVVQYLDDLAKTLPLRRIEGLNLVALIV